MTALVNIHGTEARLGDDGLWSCDAPTLERLLNSSFGLELYPPSPAAGDCQHRAQAEAAAEAFGSEVRWDNTEDYPEAEGRVY